ncbi:hypothetical protein K8M07_04480 [Schnuerera sp. xch1]|uniref:hypothetical protein n=1 Tax=Schnuerera sp. xch1 TaxID=2874283 RepID=UPI001CBE2351|nr:hypothetical protein [Schnuerera sp. xch1]MBZ2174497.1 hypothetical protein [Schnuerera sp. xch1]
MILGLFFILGENYKVKRENEEITFVEKDVDRNSGFFKYKIFLGILSIVLGVFSIINHIVY